MYTYIVGSRGDYEREKERKGETVFLKEGWTELIKGSITNHGVVDKKLENNKGKENLPQWT